MRMLTMEKRSKQKKVSSSSSSTYQPLLCKSKLNGSVFSPRKGAPKLLTRYTPPAHCILKIQAFSELAQRCNSAIFSACGYKWQLCIYPRGNSDENGGGHISIYLVMADSGSLGTGWEVQASFRFSVFDHNTGKYRTAEDGKRFNDIKKEWGFARFISLGNLMKRSNGYLVGDQCVFGVEVFDVFEDRRTSRCESMLMKRKVDRFTYTWKIPRLSLLGTDQHSSYEDFIVEDYRWRISLFKEGKGAGKGNSISLYLSLVTPRDQISGSQVFSECYLQIIDQLHGRNCVHKGSQWFNDSNRSWGFERFIPLSEFNNPEMGFLVKDTCIVKVHIAILGKANAFSGTSC